MKTDFACLMKQQSNQSLNVIIQREENLLNDKRNPKDYAYNEPTLDAS